MRSIAAVLMTSLFLYSCDSALKEMTSVHADSKTDSIIDTCCYLTKIYFAHSDYNLSTFAFEFNSDLHNKVEQDSILYKRDSLAKILRSPQFKNFHSVDIESCCLENLMDEIKLDVNAHAFKEYLSISFYFYQISDEKTDKDLLSIENGKHKIKSVNAKKIFLLDESDYMKFKELKQSNQEKFLRHAKESGFEKLTSCSKSERFLDDYEYRLISNKYHVYDFLRGQQIDSIMNTLTFFVDYKNTQDSIFGLFDKFRIK